MTGPEVLRVALDTPLRRVFDYLPPRGAPATPLAEPRLAAAGPDLSAALAVAHAHGPHPPIAPGVRVLVPFGRQRLVGVVIEKFRTMASEAGRDPATLPISIFRVPDKIDGLRFCQEIGIDRVTFTLPAEKEDKLMPIIDRWAELKHQLGG